MQPERFAAGLTPLPTAARVAQKRGALRWRIISTVISLGALAGLTSVVMILMLGQSRVLFAMSRDHLLPPALAKVHPRYGTPYRITIGTGIGLVVARELAELQGGCLDYRP